MLSSDTRQTGTEIIFKQLHANPIFKRESAYLQKQRHQRGRWYIVGLLSVMLPLAILATLPAILNFHISTMPVIMASAGLLILSHLALSVYAVAIATHSVTREEHTASWDVLVISGIDGRRIVWGKWGLSSANCGLSIAYFRCPELASPTP